MSEPRQINRSRLPHFWSGMSFVAKASYLLAQGQARTFNEAASMLAACRKRKAAGMSRERYADEMEKRKLF